MIRGGNQGGNEVRVLLRNAWYQVDSEFVPRHKRVRSLNC